MTARPLLEESQRRVDAAPRTRLGVLKVHIVEAASAALLETALGTYFGGGTIREFRLVQPIQYRCYDATHYSAFIVYTEG